MEILSRSPSYTLTGKQQASFQSLFCTKFHFIIINYENYLSDLLFKFIENVLLYFYQIASESLQNVLEIQKKMNSNRNHTKQADVTILFELALIYIEYASFDGALSVLCEVISEYPDFEFINQCIFLSSIILFWKGSREDLQQV